MNESLVIHLALSLVMFYTINWIGKHSVSLGYITLTAFLRSDTAPAFNFFFRIVSPVVLIILYASILYSTNYDRLVQDIWRVTLFYCLWRLFFILTFERIYLVNWAREAFIWVSTTGVSWIIYEYFIKIKANLLPQPEELKNEFWILLILFIYSVLNQIELDEVGTKKRKNNYIIRAYRKKYSQFHHIIESQAVDKLSESLIYAVLLYENFNRPKLIRIIEKVTFPYIAKSIGPMQVKTEAYISDFDSVKLGSMRIVKSYCEALKSAQEKVQSKNADEKFNPFINALHMKFLTYKVASDYNKDDSYVDGVTEIHQQLVEAVYPTFARPEPAFDRLDWYF